VRSSERYSPKRVPSSQVSPIMEHDLNGGSDFAIDEWYRATNHVEMDCPQPVVCGLAASCCCCKESKQTPRQCTVPRECTNHETTPRASCCCCFLLVGLCKTLLVQCAFRMTCQAYKCTTLLLMLCSISAHHHSCASCRQAAPSSPTPGRTASWLTKLSPW
jgi:hypothetical protein